MDNCPLGYFVNPNKIIIVEFGKIHIKCSIILIAIKHTINISDAPIKLWPIPHDSLKFVGIRWLKIFDPNTAIEAVQRIQPFNNIWHSRQCKSTITVYCIWLSYYFMNAIAMALHHYDELYVYGTPLDETGGGFAKMNEMYKHISYGWHLKWRMSKFRSDLTKVAVHYCYYIFLFSIGVY